MIGLHKRFSGGRKSGLQKMTTVRKNDNYSVINILFDIDCLAQYEPSI